MKDVCNLAVPHVTVWRLALYLLMAVCAMPILGSASPALAQGTDTTFDDTEAQLRVRQAANAATAAAREIEALRRALETERARVVQTDGERDLNQTTIRTLERDLKSAEARQREHDASLKAAQEARNRGLAAETRRREAEAGRHQQSVPAPPPAAAAAPQIPGQRDCPTCPEMVSLPPGAFVMGPAPAEEDEAKVLEGFRVGPTHRVVIGYSFAIGRYEVTRGEFAAFVAATGRQVSDGCRGFRSQESVEEIPGRSWRNPGFTQTDRDPVVCVSWREAKAYAAWLAQVTGKGYRLPSEAEWEYAARAGSQASRYWGDQAEGACRHGNFADLTAAATFAWDDNEPIFRCRDGFAYTAPVGSFQSNTFGLHDMLGNAAEWTEDCHNPRYDGAPADGRPWLAGSCDQRVQRGGSWFTLAQMARAASRSFVSVDEHQPDAGFRIAKSN